MGFGDIVRKYLILRRGCDLFYCENCFEMHELDPEICLFENTCFVQGYNPLKSDNLLSHLKMATQNNPPVTIYSHIKISKLLNLLQLFKDYSF